MTEWILILFIICLHTCSKTSTLLSMVNLLPSMLHRTLNNRCFRDKLVNNMKLRTRNSLLPRLRRGSLFGGHRSGRMKSVDCSKSRSAPRSGKLIVDLQYTSNFNFGITLWQKATYCSGNVTLQRARMRNRPNFRQPASVRVGQRKCMLRELRDVGGASFWDPSISSGSAELGRQF